MFLPADPAVEFSFGVQCHSIACSVDVDWCGAWSIMAADAPHPVTRPPDPSMTVASDPVVRAVARLCAPDEAERVLAALRACSATAPSAERDRVQLAVLKLWDEDPAHNLETWARAAGTDYRDVLCWAESPGEARAGDRARLSSAQLQALRAADRDQLAAWLERVV